MHIIPKYLILGYLTGIVGTWVAGITLDTFGMLKDDFSNFNVKNSWYMGPLNIISAGFAWPVVVYNYKVYIKN